MIMTDREYFSKLCELVNKLVHPYSREADPNRYDYFMQWYHFKQEYDYLSSCFILIERK